MKIDLLSECDWILYLLGIYIYIYIYIYICCKLLCTSWYFKLEKVTTKPGVDQ